MRKISMERVEQIRQNIYDTITSVTMTHEQKLTSMSCHADSLMEVIDLPEGLDELLNVPIPEKCICDLNEGHAPMRPRYIVPDYAKFMKQGSKFLQLDPPQDLWEALNSLLILYKHVPSVTNYPVFIGNLDELIEPFLEGVDDATAYKAIKLFLTHIDRTIVDSFCHADIGPKPTRAGFLIMKAEAELENATPNLTMRYDPEISGDEMGLAGVEPTREDTLCAEYIQALVEGTPINLAAEIAECKETSGAKFFDPAKTAFPEEDFWLSVEADKFDFVLHIRQGADGLMHTVRK